MEEKKEQTPAQKLREELFFAPKNGYDRLAAGEGEKIQTYCEGYKTFLDAGKTERECVDYAIARAQAAGFRPLVRGEKLQPGDKVYRNNRGKSLLLAVIGQEGLDQGAVIGAAHIDSPRLDLKQNPSMRTRSWPTARPTITGASRSTSGPPSPWPSTGWWCAGTARLSPCASGRTLAIPSLPWGICCPTWQGIRPRRPWGPLSPPSSSTSLWAAAPLTRRQAVTG